MIDFNRGKFSKTTRKKPYENNIYKGEKYYFIKDVALRLGIQNALQLFNGYILKELPKDKSSYGFENYTLGLACSKSILIEVLKKSRKEEAKKWLKQLGVKE